MRVLQALFGIFIALLVFVTATPAHAVSPTASRANDAVKATLKDYSGQNLVRAEFQKARLADSNFNGANLRGAVFSASDLTHANFHGVNFEDGIAYVTDFAGADLTDAVLTSAMMIGSRFKGAKIDGADFSLAVLDLEQVLELCKSASGVNPVTGISTHDSLECP